MEDPRFGILHPGQGALFHRKDQPLRLGKTRNEAFMVALLEGLAPPENCIFMRKPSHTDAIQTQPERRSDITKLSIKSTFP